MLTPTATKLTYAERAALCDNPCAASLFALIARKESNLCVSVDVETCAELLDITQSIAAEICLLKFHVEILSDFTWDFVQRMTELSARHDFLIVSDSKIGDIGNTAKQLYTKGIYRMAEWADFVTAHPVPGPGVIQALKEGAGELERGIFLVAQMSSAGSLAEGSYTQAAVAMAERHSTSVAGFVCQSRLTDDPRFIHFTPGVSLEDSNDALGQQFRHPRLLCQSFTDVIAVGRGIYRHQNPQLAACQYRQEGWEGYLSSFPA